LGRDGYDSARAEVESCGGGGVEELEVGGGVIEETEIVFNSFGGFVVAYVGRFGEESEDSRYK